MAWIGRTDYWVILNQLEKKSSQLEEKNYQQASMLMSRDFRIRQLEEELMKKVQEEKDNRDNVIDMFEAKLDLASKEPPEAGNWLSNLPQGTRFLAFKKNIFSSFLEDFLVGTDPKQMPAVLLGYELSHREGGFKWCDPVKFSREYGFYMTIKTELNNDGNTVQDGRVVGNGESQVVNPVHEKE